MNTPPPLRTSFASSTSLDYDWGDPPVAHDLSGLAGHDRGNAPDIGVAERAINQQLAAALGGANVLQLAATETCAGMWARTLSAATVKPDFAAAILTPDLLGMVGRALFQRGEFAARLMVQRGRLVAVPCTVANVSGNSTDPMDWSYLLDMPTPAGIASPRVGAPDVWHVRYGAEPSAPWRGVSPLERAKLDASIASFLSYRISQESARETGTMVGGTDYKNAMQAEALENVQIGLQGRTRAVGGFSSLPTARLGFQPPSETRARANDQERRIMGTGGIAPPLFLADSDGTAAREAFRRYTNSTLAYLGELVAVEASAKLETDVTLSFERLRGVDSQGLARAVKSLVDADVPLADALVTVGLV